MAKLTPKQKKFADEYIKTGNATNSYMNSVWGKGIFPLTQVQGPFDRENAREYRRTQQTAR